MDFLSAASAASLNGPESLSVSVLSESGESESEADCDDDIMMSQSSVTSVFSNSANEEYALSRVGRVLRMVWSMLLTICGIDSLKALVD